MKTLYSLVVIILLAGCNNTRQKTIQTLCNKVGKQCSNCTKTVGLISATAVENQFPNNNNPQQGTNTSPSLLDVQDSFSW